MKRTVFLLAVLLPCAALIGILWDGEGSPFRSTPSVAERGSARVRNLPASRPAVISMAEGSGADLFIQRDAEVEVGGRTVKFPRSYSYAATWSDGGSGVILAKDPVIVFNAPPRDEFDLTRMLVVDTSRGPREAGAQLRDALHAHTGIRSDQARIHGPSDLSSVSRVEFAGNVRGGFVDPEVPRDRVYVETDSLTADFEDNALAAVRTDAAIIVTRPDAKDLTLTGIGLDVVLAEGRATLRRDVSFAMVPPPRRGVAQTAIRLSSPGPLVFQGGRDDRGRAGKFGLAGGRVTASGGVAFEQGEVQGAARTATIVTGTKGDVESLELVDAVRVRTADGEVLGSRLVVTPRDEEVFVRIHGQPVVVRPAAGGAAGPAQLGGDVVLKTTGTIVISPVRRAADGGEERTIEVGPSVSVTGTTGSLEARRILVRVPSATGPDVKPFRITFEKVTARDPETELTCDSVTVVRGGPAASPEDLITIPGAYEIAYRPKPKGGPAAREPEAPEAVPATRRDVPPLGGGPADIRGNGGLTITRPVFDDRPLLVAAREPFRVEMLDAADGAVRATLEAARGELVAERSGAAAAPGERPSRHLASFVADGRVRVELPKRASARGTRLTYDARVRQVVLVGSGTDDPARIDRIEGDARERLAAGKIIFQLDILRLIATQAVTADLALAPLAWVGTTPSRERVATQLTAQRLVASLDAEKFARGEIAPSEVVAEMAVKLVQPGRKLSADVVRMEPGKDVGSIRGAPLRYEVVREVDGVALPESLTCPAILMEDGKVLVEGPAEALLHARSGFGGALPPLKDGGKAPPAPAGPEPQEPVRLRCGSRALVTPEFVRADGRAAMEQGDPRAPSLQASADSVTLFLEKDPAAPSSTPDFALAVLEGNAKFDSPDIEAASDVMKINRVTKHATLLNQRPEKLTVIVRRSVVGSEVHNGVARLDIDFTDPQNPAVTAFDHEITLGSPDTRPARR